MKAVTTRIPDEYEALLTELEDDLGASRSETVRRLIEESLDEWRKERAIDLLRKHAITIRRAAEVAGVTYVEMLDLASREGVEVGYTAEELERDLERI